MNEDAAETTDDEKDSTEKYYLCPVCSTEKTPYGEKTEFLLAGHFNRVHSNQKKGGSGEQWEDFKPLVKTTTDKPPNLIAKEKPKKPKRTKEQTTGGKMPTDDDNESETQTAELGEGAAVRGTIRTLLKDVANLDESKRYDLISQKEQLVEFMRLLSATKSKLDATLVQEIELKIDTEIKPVIRAYTHPGSGGTHGGKDINTEDQPMTDERMKAQKLRSKIKHDLENIANLPSRFQDELIAEKEMLMGLNRKLCKDGVTKEDLQDMEASYSGSHPFIDSVIKKGHGKKKGRGKTGDDWDDDDDDDDDDWDDEFDRQEMRELKRKERMLRYKARIAEYQQNLESIQGSKPQPGNAPGLHVMQRPRLDPRTGQMELDEEGKPILEYHYAQPGMSGDSMAMTLLTAVLPSLIAGGVNKGGTSPREYELMLEKQRLEIEKDILERQRENPGNSESSQELREIRNEMRAQQERHYQAEMTRLENELQRTRHALANSDPLTELVEQKEKLIQLGMVRDPKEFTEDKQTAYANKVLDETKNIIQKGTSDLKSTLEPLTEISREDMKLNLEARRKKMERESEERGEPPQPPPQPRRMTEEEKRRKWNQVFNAMEEED